MAGLIRRDCTCKADAQFLYFINTQTHVHWHAHARSRRQNIPSCAGCYLLEGNWFSPILTFSLVSLRVCSCAVEHALCVYAGWQHLLCLFVNQSVRLHLLLVLVVIESEYLFLYSAPWLNIYPFISLSTDNVLFIFNCLGLTVGTLTSIRSHTDSFFLSFGYLKVFSPLIAHFKRLRSLIYFISVIHSLILSLSLFLSPSQAMCLCVFLVVYASEFTCVWLV